MLAISGAAQDTIKINGQPTWSAGLDIADYCIFFEEVSDTALSFEQAQKQIFAPYAQQFRKQKKSNRPLIIEWFKFVVHNTSSTDTIKLQLNTIHYFTRLYAAEKLVGLSGAYEKKAIIPGDGNFAFIRGHLPLIVPPDETIVYYFRTEDRQSQLVPPQILLDTSYLGLKQEVKSTFEARYLFLIMAAMVGCFFFIGVYALYNFYLYRHKSFAWYITYTIAGFLSALHWMDIRLGLAMFSPLMHDVIFSIFIYVTPVLYSFFIGAMLDLNIHFKKAWLLVKSLVIVCLLQMLLEFIQVRFGWFPFNRNYYGLFIIPIPIAILNIVLMILTAKSKDPVKWFLFVGVSSLLILWCLPLLKPYSPTQELQPEIFLIVNFPIFYLMLGLVVEAICFSFALTYRSKLILVEKNSLQKNYNHQLQQELQQRTLELQQKNKVVGDQKIKQIQTEFEQKIAETEMIALRAQMNPHFIFNCLNSIKLYTLENDSHTASEYLTKFSQLIRLVLDNSRSEKITLQKELETLVLYIELEAMRFKHKVKYQINVSPGIDQQYVEIPPLLIQPYVENAIWHGLMHKHEGGNILIEIIQLSEDMLHVEITDDGIGRTMAMQHKSKTATRQKSYGLKMTAERLAAINHIYKTNTAVEIIDLSDVDGHPCGTKVIIEIPI